MEVTSEAVVDAPDVTDKRYELSCIWGNVTTTMLTIPTPYTAWR